MRRDVGGKFYDLYRLAGPVEDRIVACLYPDFPTALGKSLEFVSLVQPLRQTLPEGAVLIAAGVIGRNEHRMMLAHDLFECVAHGGEKIFVGGQNSAIERKLDHSLRAINGLYFRLRLTKRSALFSEHTQYPQNASHRRHHLVPAHTFDHLWLNRRLGKR